MEANKIVRGNYGVERQFFTQTVIETVRPAKNEKPIRMIRTMTMAIKGAFDRYLMILFPWFG